MSVQKVSTLKFGLADETINHVEKSTRCSIGELSNLDFRTLDTLMLQRGTKKKPSKIKEWFANQYRKFGEKTGFLKRQYNIYTDID